ncbi:hypothetical protein DSO57_1019413 [Entomophthora muscae]|uniref:Uncharacterized protein n=1 Tax=Entomophthora muscae TaxID=34485 RepID=A0ACC2UPQ4_9FUNG|nr:hypothetical protein DSO57_1019413 [Entomophthora muscae]
MESGCGPVPSSRDGSWLATIVDFKLMKLMAIILGLSLRGLNTRKTRAGSQQGFRVQILSLGLGIMGERIFNPDTKSTKQKPSSSKNAAPKPSPEQSPVHYTGGEKYDIPLQTTVSITWFQMRSLPRSTARPKRPPQG